MRGKYMLLAAVAALLLASAVSYAATYSASVQIAVSAGTNTTITAATNNGKYAVAPAWSAAVTNTAGGVTTPGDLYVVNASSHAADSVVRLYLTNTDKLATAYSNFNAVVSLYEYDTGSSTWSLAAGTSAETVSINNSVAEFKVTGGKKYSISVDGGNNYCLDSASPNLTPAFMADVTN